MDYTLSAKRTVNGGLQTGVVILQGTSASTSQNYILAQLNNWLNILTGFDGTRTVTAMVDFNLNEFESDDIGNGYGHADVTLSILGSLTDGSLKSVTVKVENITTANAVTQIQNKVTAVSGINLTTNLKYVITNAVFVLHT